MPTLEMAPQSREIATAQERFAQLAESFGARWKGDNFGCVARRAEAEDIAAGIRGTYKDYPRPTGYNPIEEGDAGEGVVNNPAHVTPGKDSA